MSKPYYETEEYNEAENELDTYDDPVKLVMEYRISEKHKDNKIADLEAKLAELREQIAICDEENGKIFMQCFNAMRENVELKQQLVEKDKEIEQVTSKLQASYEKEQNQKAIEQLEKVKGLIANHTQELWTCENDDIDVVLYEEIDNQIKQLNGGK